MKRQQHQFPIVRNVLHAGFGNISSPHQEEDCKKSQLYLSDGYAITLLCCTTRALQRMP